MTVNERYQGIIKMRASEQFGNKKAWMRDTEAEILAQITKDEIAQIANFQKQLADQPTEKLVAMMLGVKEKIAKIEAGEFMDNIEFLRFFRRAIALKQELGGRNGN